VQTNLIAGNGLAGVLIEDLGDGGSADDNTGDNNLVADNIIGLGFDVVQSLPNMNGIVMYDGTDNNTIRSNYIAGNAGWGIDIQSSTKIVSGTQILSNTIGLGAKPNRQGGVRLTDAASTAIGLPGAGNLIAGNGNFGAEVASGPGVAIRNGELQGSINNRVAGSNAIHSNATLGIDLGADGVSGNDPSDSDTGPNGRQNAPVLTSVSSEGSPTRIEFTFNSVPSSSYTVDFFVSATCDASGYGEGQLPVGAGIVITTNSDGNFNGGIDIIPGVEWRNFTAIATDEQGNSSEFSNCLAPEASGSAVTASLPALYTLSARPRADRVPRALTDRVTHGEAWFTTAKE